MILLDLIISGCSRLLTTLNNTGSYSFFALNDSEARLDPSGWHRLCCLVYIKERLTTVIKNSETINVFRIENYSWGKKWDHQRALNNDFLSLWITTFMQNEKGSWRIKDVCCHFEEEVGTHPTVPPSRLLSQQPPAERRSSHSLKAST